MANRSNTELDQQRTKTWARYLAVTAGVREGKRLEQLICDRSDMNCDEPSGIFRAYLTGKRKPFVKWMPTPRAPWVDRADVIWPSTRDWFYTPVWYLLEEQEYLASQIMECVRLLPPRFKNILLLDSHERSPAALTLGELWLDRIYELVDPVSPWALGAMACALRRAELAGQSPIFRQAGVGLIWLLDRLIPELDPWVQEPVKELRSLIMQRLATIVYPGSALLRVPISKNDLDRFTRGVIDFVAKRDALFNHRG